MLSTSVSEENSTVKYLLKSTKNLGFACVFLLYSHESKLQTSSLSVCQQAFLKHYIST